MSNVQAFVNENNTNCSLAEAQNVQLISYSSSFMNISVSLPWFHQ